MSRGHWLAVTLATVMMLASACGSAPRAAASRSPSPTTTGVHLLSPIPVPTSPVPAFEVSPASSARVASGTRLQTPWPTPPAIVTSNRKLALVQLSGSDATVVRDVTNIDQPFTVGTVPVPGVLGPYGDRFISPDIVSAIDYADGSKYQLSLLTLGGGRQPVLEVDYEDLSRFSWSPDATQLSFLVGTATNATWEWHLASGGTDRIIATPPGICYCGEGTQDMSGIWLDYSPDGRYISFVEYALPGIDFQVRTTDGALIGQEIRYAMGSSSFVTMPVWSGTGLYFRDQNGVEVWRDGAVSAFLPGVAWIAPKASPAGGRITYAARDPSGRAHIYVVETATGKVTQLGSTEAWYPTFLTDRYVWYQGERLCPRSECPLGTVTSTGRDYIYDLQTGSEFDSRITNVVDVWPHPT